MLDNNKNLKALFDRLIEEGNILARTNFDNLDDDEEQSQLLTTTIRLNPKTRRYYEAIAQTLGVSLQSVMASTLTGVMESSIDSGPVRVGKMSERFFTLLKTHNIDLSNVPALLKNFEITLGVLANRKELLNHLTPELISYLANLFSVEQGWLNGEAVNPTRQVGYWNANAHKICDHLLNLAAAPGNRVQVIFVKDRKVILEEASKINDIYAYPNGEVGVIIEIDNDVAGISKFKTYEWWGAESWAHPKYRHELKLIMLFCMQRRRRLLDYSGISLKDGVLAQLKAGSVLIAAALANGNAWSNWYVEDYVSDDYSGAQETEELENVSKGGGGQR